MWNMLKQAKRGGALVDLRRDGISGELRGFVAALTVDFTVLSVVDENCRFNGVTVVQTKDVSFLRWGTSLLKAWTRLLAESPSSPEPTKHLDLEHWASVLTSAVSVEPVLTIHRENIDPDVCNVLTNVRVDGEYVQADEVSVEGSVDGELSVCLKDLTRLDFGGGYERAMQGMMRLSG